MQIGEKHYTDSSDYFSVFWRIDTDDNGPYISLRLYENFDKKLNKLGANIQIEEGE